MPRQPRLVVSEYPHHIVLRGNNRRDIFYDDRERFFSNLIRSTMQKDGVIGNKEFIEKIAKALGRNVILRPKRRPGKSL